MSWRMDSTAGAAIWDTEPMSGQDLLCRDEEILWLKQQGRAAWKLINGRLAKSGHPTNNLGAYSSLGAYPPVAAATSTAVTTATPGTTIWTVALYSPIVANAVTAGSAFHIYASGTVQTSTSGLTLTLLPSIGTGLMNAAPTTHQDLGVGGAGTLGSTLTSIWHLVGDLTIRSPGTAGTCWFMGVFYFGNIAVPVTSAATVDVILGGTVATVDWTGTTANYPGGLQFSGWGAATVTVVTQAVHWTSL